jgi:IclR family acetate operon transcriptional repressor
MAAPDGESQTLRRALDMVEAIASANAPVTVRSLSETTALPVPTAYRLLRTLVASGYVRQVPGRRYALGLTLMRLGKIASTSAEAAADPFLRELVEATGETSNFAVLDGDRVVYVAQAPSPHPMRMFTEIGHRVMLHSTGVGKAILSQMSDERVVALAGRTGLPGMTDRTHTTVAALLEDLHVIRERGWAEDDGEQELGVRCVAAPVRMGQLSAAVSVSGPDARVNDEAVARFAPEVARVAAQLSEALSNVLT